MTSAMAAHQDSIHERLQVTEEPYLHHESNWNQEQDENIDGPYYHLPKRNKRKNFKPRCAPNTNTSDEHTNTEVITESDVVDLSRRLSNESNEKKTNFDLKNPFAISQLIKNSPRRRDSDETKSDINANDRLDTDEVQQNGEGNKILRDYAVNTMKELLGIYGLSSNEVTDTISSQMRALEAIHGKGLQSVLLPVKRRHSSHESGRRSSSGTDDDRNSVTSPKTPDENEEQRQRTLQYLSQQSLRLFGRSYPGGRADDEDASCSEDGEQTLDLSVAASKECDGQDLSRNSSANNSLSEYEQKLMRKNMEDLANLQMQGYFPKSASLMDLEDSQEMRKLPTTGLLSALSQLDQARKIAGQASIDYSRYVKRYGSALECGSSYCKDLGYREHFHCLDCVTRVFCKKEEMIRHFKWHKKRDESLAHGFMRYSPLDDCSERYMDCPHNRSQTHYHCIQDGCDKVYISTSDVQMHANYHRKDSAILQEGFQRFRATETCTTSHCAFRGQRTTHFHCRRDGCTYTFKNKADMEKHKTYHIKDEQLARDGFKKYLKNEGCPYSGCRLSKVCNHIHCTRRACSYVLHSSSQLYTHKRKHERQDRDGITGFSGSPIVQSHVQGDSVTSPTNSFYNDGDDIINMATGTGSVDGDNGTGISSMEDIFEKYIDTFAGGKEPEDKCPKCSAFNKHYHCIAEGCNMEHSCHTTMTKHSLEHEHQQQITESYFMTYTTSNQCTNSACQHIRDITHYHCTWDNCSTVILSSEDQPFKRLEHYRQHAILKPISPNLAKLTPNLTTQLNHPTPLPNLAQLAQMAPNLVGHGLPTSLGLGPNPVGLPTQSLQHINAASSLDEMFSRKRGRPPKNRVVEVWTDNVTPQAIFTSFKLPKCNQTIIPNTALIPNAEEYSRIKFQNFEVFSAPDTCTQSYTNCQLKHSKLHLHCSLCPFSSENHPTMETHTRESHNITPLLVGFDYFNNYDHCNQSNCFKNQLRQHFHCNQVVNCNAILTQYSVVATHKHSKEEPDEIRDYSMKEREMADLGCVKEMDSFSVKEEPFEKDADGALNVSVVKATGTFYPSSHLKSSPSPSQVSSDASRTPDAKETSKYTGIPVPCTDQLCPLNKGTPSLHYHCNHCNQTYADLKSLYGHMIKKHSGSMDAATMGLAATKETLEREYPEISILPSTVTSSSMNTTEQPRTPNTAEQVQAVQSLLLQQYLSASSLQQHQNKKTSHQQQQAPSLQEQLKLQQQYNASMLPALSQAHLAQMAFLQGGSPFPLYPSMLYPPELLLEQGLLQHGLQPHVIDKDVELMMKNRQQTSRGPHMRIMKDEPIPEGYLRFRFNEDCGYQHCGYREHQTHFHCTRKDCGYSFCDKTRFVQHTARHERLDTLMGGDFQQYRANVYCNRTDCVHANNFGSGQNKASHFHCLKCEFVCTDTNKVVAHRRQHQKMDSIQAAGFEKYPPSKGCGFEPQCIHSKKQTHYHCLQCGFAVLGLSQMTSHKYKHQETNQGQGPSTSNTN